MEGLIPFVTEYIQAKISKDSVNKAWYCPCFIGVRDEPVFTIWNFPWSVL